MTETAKTPAAKAAKTDAKPAQAKKPAAAKASAEPAAVKAAPVTKKAAPATKKAAPAAKKTAKKSAKKSPARKPAKSKSSPKKDTIMNNAQTTAVNETIEKITAAGNEAFKEGFEKSIKSINDVSAFQKDNLDAVIASATVAGKGAEKLNADTMNFAKKSMEDTVAASKALTSAKSVQEMIELQTNFMKSSMDAYMSQINSVTDLYAGTVKDAMAPLNARVSAAVEMVQSQR